MTQHQITITSMTALLSPLHIIITPLLRALPWVLFLETHFSHPFLLSLLRLAALLASAVKWLSILSLLTLLSPHRFVLGLSLPVPEFSLHSCPWAMLTDAKVLTFALYTMERLFIHLSSWTAITSGSLFFPPPEIQNKRIFSVLEAVLWLRRIGEQTQCMGVMEWIATYGLYLQGASCLSPTSREFGKLPVLCI